MPRNISPTTAQRAALGSVVKMIQDPQNYKQLLLFGSQGCLICADHTAASPRWRAANLSSTSDLAWSQLFDFTTSNGGWAASTDGFAGNESTHSAGVGWIQVACTRNLVNTASYDIVYVELPLPALSTLTHVDILYSATVGDLSDGGGDAIQAYYSGAWHTLTSQASANGVNRTLAWNGSQTSIEKVRILLYGASLAGSSCPTPGTATLKTLNMSGTGSNPFGGSGGGASNVTYFGDMVGSINKKGWFGWLGQDGADVWFYYTANYFQTRKRVNIAPYDSNKVYTISVGSYGNNTTKGVVLVTAGTSVYKSTNYGVSFSDLSIVVNDSGGPIVVPFAKNGGSVNAGTSPQYLLVKGVSTNLQTRSLAGSTVTLASGSSHVPIGPYSLNVFKQDGAYCWCIMSDGTFYTSVDGGGTWSAQATPTHTGTVYGASGSPKNLAFVLAFGNECLAYSADSGAAWISLYSSYRTWADANIGSGKAQTIVTALVDLALLYSKPVSQ